MALTRPKYSTIIDTDFKTSVRVATTGSSITLSGGAPSTLDGVTLVQYDRILVKDQSPASQNGIYRVSTPGTGSNGTWVRAYDANINASVTAGQLIPVTEGTQNSGHIFLLSTPDPIVLDTTNLTYVSAGFNSSGINTITNTNVSTSTTTGALTIAGGVGIGGNIYVGANANITGNVNVTGNILSPSLQNGNSSVNIAANANVTITAKSNATVVVTDTGANITGTANISGNANIGNIGTATAIITTGNITTVNSGLIQNGNSNIAVTANSNVTITAKSNATVIITDTGANISGTANITGNANVGNLGTGGLIVATGNVTGGNLIATNNLQVSGNKIKSSTGNAAITLSDIDVTVEGNLTVQGVTTTLNTTTLDVEDLNITVAKGAASAAAANGAGLTVDGASASLIYNNASNTWVFDRGLTVNGIANITGNANIGNVGTATIIATTANLTTINSSLVQNGTSNVTVNSSGNVNISVGGNVLTVTSTGANITGTANISSTLSVSGNANTGNLGTGTIIATTANLTTINSGLVQNGTSNVTVNSSGNVNISVGGNVLTVTSTGANVAGYANITGNLIVGTNANITGTANITGNANVGNLGTAQVLASANITAPQLISNVATGTAPLVVTSTTQVANMNVATASNLINGTSNVVVTSSGNITVGSAGNAAILTVTGTGANVGGYLSVALGSITAAQPILSKSVTWNNASVTFTALSTSITDTASAAGSNIADWQVGGVSKFSVNKAGNTSVAGTLNVTGNANVGNLGAGSGTITTTGNLLGGNANITANANVGNLNYTGNLYQGGTLRYAHAYTASTAPPGTSTVGDWWYDTGSDKVYLRINDGTTSYWLDTTSKPPSLIAGTSNVVVTSNGNVVMGVAGNAQIFTVTGTGANVSGTLNVTANLSGGNVITAGYMSASGNITSTAGYFKGDGGLLTNISASAGASITNGNSNVVVISNGNVTVSSTGTANVVVVSNTGANITGTLGVTGNITGNYILGNGSQLTGIITTVSNVINGTSNINIASSGSNITVGVAGNANVLVISGTGANITGTANVSGNANVGNLGTGTIIATTANLTTINSGLLQNSTSNVTVASAGNVSTFIGGNVTAQLIVTATGANISGTANVVGNANVGNLGTATAIITTANITTINSGLLQNGTSNVTVNSSGNVNISVGGNILTVTSTGANIAGTLNTGTGNANVGNLGTGTVIATTANLTTINGALHQNGNSNVTITANGNVTVTATSNATLVVTSTGANIAGTLNTGTGNANVGNLGTATAIITTANVTTINSGLVQNGTSNVTVNSNGNVNISVGGNVLTVTSSGANVAGTANITGNILAGANIVYTGNLYQGATLRYAHAYTASTAAPSGSTLGDYWYDTATDILYLRVSDGVTPLWFDVSSQANTFSDTTTTNATITTASITTANISGNINAANLQNGNSNVRIVANGNISVSVGGTANVEVWSTAGANITGTLGVTGNITGGNVSGTLLTGTLTTAAQPNITSVGTLTSLTVSGGVTIGSNVTGYLTPKYGITFARRDTNADMYIMYSAAGSLTWYDNVGAADRMYLSAGGNLYPAGNGTQQMGLTTNRWSNIWGLASSAQYADLAERYLSDSDYDPGTVVIFGGNAEITVTTADHDPRIAGVISTNPGYLMNDHADQDELMLPVALQGRVPTRVRGPIRKGDMVVSSAEPGVGIRMKKALYEPGCVIGKSLENIDDDSIHTIEVVVGRL